MIVLFVLAFCVIAFFVATILSFATNRQPLRRVARRAAVGLGVAFAILIVAAFVAFRLFFGPPPPTLGELQRRFPRQRNDLQTILRMSNEDRGFFRIDPTFLDQDGIDGKIEGRHMAGDQKAALPKARWDQYRVLFKKNDIDQGIERNRDGDAFIRVASQGLLNRGHGSGYVYCEASPPAPPTGTFRYEPCTSDKDEDTHLYTGGGDMEGYSYKKLAEHWYAYDQGPS